MVGIALQVADLAVLQVDVDAAAAGAHVAGRLLDLVCNLRAGIDLLWRRLQRVLDHRSSLSRPVGHSGPAQRSRAALPAGPQPPLPAGRYEPPRPRVPAGLSLRSWVQCLCPASTAFAIGKAP